MKEFLNFRQFITPVIIQILFWIGVAFCVIVGLVTMGNPSSGGVIGGLALIIFGPIFVRIYCELLILIFKIYERLASLDDKTPNNNIPQQQPPMYE